MLTAKWVINSAKHITLDLHIFKLDGRLSRLLHIGN
jgi:hypothetical protein